MTWFLRVKQYALWLLGKRRRHRVTGHSMWPVLRDGEIVFSRAVSPTELQVGDIVVTQHPHRHNVQIIKRINAIAADQIQLTGENADSDASIHVSPQTIERKICTV